MSHARDIYSRFVHAGDVLLRRGNQPIGLIPLASELKMNVGELRGCFDGIKAKHGSHVLEITTKGTRLSNLGISLLRSLKQLPGQLPASNPSNTEPVIMIDVDVERQFITKLTGEQHKALEAEGGYRVVPFESEALDDLLGSGRIACGIGWNRKQQPRDFHVMNAFPMCIVTVQGHWCTVEGHKIGSYQPLQSNDRLAYVESDYGLNGVGALIDSLSSKQRLCCTSYSSVMQHVMHGKVGLLPFHSAWLSKHACQLAYRILTGVAPATLGVYHREAHAQLPSSVRRLLAILTDEVAKLVAANDEALSRP